MTKVGILALQGAFREHEQMLQKLGVETAQIRLPKHLENIDALVIPGGESTTIGKLMVAYELGDPIKEKAAMGMPVFGTCAGMIMLAKEIAGLKQYSLDLMDICVVRNGFGRQVDSFEAELDLADLEKPFTGVFIRAPYVSSVKDNVRILGSIDDKIIMVQQGNLLGAAFHPELTHDTRVHEYFLNMIK
ncbi:MAG: pyridoxal 5'-phosphate synthase glutaminase subunit PdxT [Bacillota bacterium]|jgi:5'-phosphate synthase pdxT subunit